MSPPASSGRVLVTGGAGFIGSNVAERLLERGERVVLLDNLSRPNVERNVAWLHERFGGQLELVVGDVRDPITVSNAVRGVDHVFHFAAQVAVTTSLVDPVDDFAVNALGTLNVLEAIRASSSCPSLILTSTNKVYGALADVALVPLGRRYAPKDDRILSRGIGEDRPLAFHSPYGCSKGAADQYVLDYARSFGLRTCVFRMSCIYGTRQLGTEDQGWVAHFLIRALRGEPITIYGDGLQVRDVLYVSDLVDAFERARADIGALAGRAFNVGGGPGNTLSLLELVEMIAELRGARPRLISEGWRVGDQRYYVSDVARLEAATGWRPRVGVREGVRRLEVWLRDALQVRAEPGRSTANEVAP